MVGSEGGQPEGSRVPDEPPSRIHGDVRDSQCASHSSLPNTLSRYVTPTLPNTLSRYATLPYQIHYLGMPLFPTKYTIQVCHSSLPNTLSRYVTLPYQIHYPGMSLFPTKYTIQVCHSSLPNRLSRYVTPPY